MTASKSLLSIGKTSTVEGNLSPTVKENYSVAIHPASMIMDVANMPNTCS